MDRVLLTGGAGFVGANLAVALRDGYPDWEVIAFDNLHRRGTELNLPRLERAGVEFVKGDVRKRKDLTRLSPVTAIVECSAEPSILAGRSDTRYAVETNLLGAYNCLELARRDGAGLVFLSTSRVYPAGALNSIAYRELETRFVLDEQQVLQGISTNGVSEQFPLEGARTLYGATKLAAELLVAEYREDFGLRAVVNRCGVIAGPWQMGRVDQGVFTWWVLCHALDLPLRYIGYGGEGKQVRDVLHVADLAALVNEQLAEPERWSGATVNVGGGADRSLSLAETTDICRELTAKDLEIGSEVSVRPGDVPIYISDCSKLFGLTSWRPSRSARQTLEEIHAWISEDPEALRNALKVEGAVA